MEGAMTNSPKREKLNIQRLSLFQHVNNVNDLETFNLDADQCQQLEFNSLPEFYDWKKEMEKETGSSYVKYRGQVRKPNGDVHIYFYCSCPGIYQPEIKDISGLNAQESEGNNLQCSARINVKMKDEKVFVVHIKKHEKQSVQIAKDVQGAIAGNLSTRNTVERVSRESQDSRTSSADENSDDENLRALETTKAVVNHEKFEFNSLEKFYEWKEKMEIDTCTSFVKYRGQVHRPNGKVHIYYYCSWSGKSQPKERDKEESMSQDSKKSNVKCSARINVRIKGKKVFVTHIKTHDKHLIQVKNDGGGNSLLNTVEGVNIDHKDPSKISAASDVNDENDSKATNAYMKFEKLEFESLTEFLKWKEDMENETHSSFVKYRPQVHSPNGDVHIYYVCCHTGVYHSNRKRIRKRNSPQTKKSDDKCPARINVKIRDDKVFVSYLKNHDNHYIHNVHNLDVPMDFRSKIADKLMSGDTIESIIADIQSFTSNNQEKTTNSLRTTCLDISKQHLEFDTLEEFLKWKEMMEKKTCSSYLKLRGDVRRPNGHVGMYYNCCPPGTRNRPKGKGIRELNSPESEKSNDKCSARIVVNMKSNKLFVTHFRIHDKHSTPLHNHEVSMDVRTKIAEKLLSGATIKSIMDDIQDSCITEVSSDAHDKNANEVDSTNADEIAYEQLQFESLMDFFIWKEEMEKETCSSYVKLRGDIHKPNGDVHSYYDCCRSGTYQPKGKGIRKLKSQDSKKINDKCSARLNVTMKNDKVFVKHFKKHDKHSTQIEHLRLPKKVRNTIAEKLLSGASVEKIIDDIRDSAESTSAVDRSFHVSKRDVYNAKRDLRRKNLEALSIELWLEEMSEQDLEGKTPAVLSGNQENTASPQHGPLLMLKGTIRPIVMPSADSVSPSPQSLSDVHEKNKSNLSQQEHQKVHEMLGSLRSVVVDKSVKDGETLIEEKNLKRKLEPESSTLVTKKKSISEELLDEEPSIIDSLIYDNEVEIICDTDCTI